MKNNYKRIMIPGWDIKADYIMCVSLAKNVNPDIEVIATNDASLLDGYKNDKETLICGMGEGELDHHRGSTPFFDGPMDDKTLKKSAYALLFDKFVKEEGMHKATYAWNSRELIAVNAYKENDAHAKENYVVKLCESAKNNWNEHSSNEEIFKRCVDLLTPWIGAQLEETKKDERAPKTDAAFYRIDNFVGERGRAKKRSEEAARNYWKEKMSFDESAEKGYVISEKDIPCFNSLKGSPVFYVIINNDKEKVFDIYAINCNENDERGVTKEIPDHLKSSSSIFSKDFAEIPYNGDKDKTLKVICDKLEEVDRKDIEKTDLAYMTLVRR